MRNRIKKFKKIQLPLTASTLSVGVLCVVFIWFKLYPFGEKTLAWGDMKQQVIPLMLEFKDILSGKSGFMFNLQNAGGMSFWGVFFFFLSSPFTFLIAFVEKSDVYHLVNVLVMAKISLSAFTSSLFFKEEEPNLTRTMHLALSVAYSLSGYALLYYQNIVWLDILYLFPILMLGFQKIVTTRKAKLFTVSLSAIIVTNYYLSYMVILALIFITAQFVKTSKTKEEAGEISAKIGAGTVISLLLTAVIWLPSLLQCLRSARTSYGFVETIQQGKSFTELSTTLPILLCTCYILILPALFLLFKLNQKQKTLLKLHFLVIIPIFLEPINKLWHTGSYQAFPVRYGYIPIFLGLWCFADIVSSNNQQPKFMQTRWGKFIIPCTVIVSISAAVFLLSNFERITRYTKSLWFDIRSFYALFLFASILSAVLLLSTWLWRKNKITGGVLGSVALILCLAQGVYHSSVLVGSAANTAEKGRTVLQLEGTISDSGFYRVKTSQKFCDVNLIGALGYNTLNHYTSLTDEKFLQAIKKLGYSSYWMETSSHCGTKISDILLSNKYCLTNNLEWEKTGSGNLGYILSKNSLPNSILIGNRLVKQNLLFKSIAGENSPALEEYKYTKIRDLSLKSGDYSTTLNRNGKSPVIIYEIKCNSPETIYFDAFGENTNRLHEPINGAFTVIVNEKILSEAYPSQDYNGIFELGTFENETVKIEIHLNKNVKSLTSFGVYGLKRDKLNTFTESLANADLYQAGNSIAGTAISTEPEQILFLSIPYSPEMQIEVNSSRIEPRIVLDCFLAIPLEDGENYIKITLVPQGIRFGATLSFIGAALLVLCAVLSNHPNGFNLILQKIAPVLLRFTSRVALVLIYIAPIIIWSLKFL